MALVLTLRRREGLVLQTPDGDVSIDWMPDDDGYQRIRIVITAPDAVQIRRVQKGRP